MRHDRCIATVILSISIIFVVGIIKPQPIVPLAMDRFWVVKTHTNKKVDIVLMGDSRVYRGLSPQAMHSVLPSYDIFNLGYSSGGLNPTMYEEAEQRLDKSSPNGIILGITPHSLTFSAGENEQYLQEKERPFAEILQRRHLNPHLAFFAPITPVQITQLIEPPSRIYYQEFHDDGWVASWTVSEDPSRALKSYRKTLQETEISEDLVKLLFKQTRKWKEKGIIVVGFRPPTTVEMEKLENTFTSFQEQNIAQKFEEAGGIWLSFPLERYHSYDGSHLHKESAIRLSRDLARAIKPYFP